MAEVRRIAPSGQNVVVDLPTRPELGSVTSHVRFTGPRISRIFQAVPPGIAAAMAEQGGTKGELLDRFVVQGREVTVTRSRPEEIIVAWHGPYHELVTVFAPAAPTRAQVLDILKQFKLADSPAGLAITPGTDSGIATANEGLFFTVPGFAVLSVPNPRNAQTLLPPNKGMQTKHGEVWRASLNAEGSAPVAETSSAKEVRFILGTAAGAAEVFFEPDPGVSDNQFLDWLDQVNVSWK